MRPEWALPRNPFNKDPKNDLEFLESPKNSGNSWNLPKIPEIPKSSGTFQMFRKVPKALEGAEKDLELF